MPSKIDSLKMKDTQDSKTSWAEQVELGDEGILSSSSLPLPMEMFDEDTGIKKVTEYKLNDEGKKIKIIKTYKVETRKVSKTVARRKALKKFGEAENDPPGPNPANTVISEEILMQFVHSKDQAEQEEDPLSRLKGKIVTCRICKGDHWTNKCPYKDSLAPLQEGVESKKGEEGEKAPAASAGSTAPGGTVSNSRPGKYIPPGMREGGNKRGESMNMRGKTDDQATIRVSNLSEDTRESDLQDLFRPFGSISRIYLAKDKITGQSKGFAFINFFSKDDAAKAIKGVSGYGYDHLILSVEWARPSPN